MGRITPSEETLKLTTEVKKMLDNAKVVQTARERGCTEEEVVFSIIKRYPALFGALNDWDDIRPITLCVIRELMPFMTFEKVFNTILTVLTLYDTQVISVCRAYSDVKRLAYFVNEMIETLLEVDGYERSLIEQYETGNDNRVVLRGIVLKRITGSEVQKLFLNDQSRFFKAEVYCTSGFEVSPHCKPLKSDTAVRA